MKLEWLQKEGIGPCPTHKAASRNKSFIEKTLTGIGRLLSESIFAEAFAAADGPLQRMDPRVKVALVALLIITVSLLRHLSLFAAIYPGIILLVVISRIPLRFFLTRVWVFIGVFSGLLAIPALFNVFVPGDPLLTIVTFEKAHSFGPYQLPQAIAITRQGLGTASLFIMRVASSVSLVVLLVLTTRWASLLKALRVLRVPRMFTFILAMTFRYIHMLLRLIEEMHLARMSRVIRKTSAGAGQKWIGSQIGVVLKKSLSTGEDVYSAMVSRGYTDELKVLDTFRVRPVDYLWSGFALLAVSVVLWLNRTFG